jgi:hypothetical protein
MADRFRFQTERPELWSNAGFILTLEQQADVMTQAHQQGCTCTEYAVLRCFGETAEPAVAIYHQRGCPMR